MPPRFAADRAWPARYSAGIRDFRRGIRSLCSARRTSRPAAARSLRARPPHARSESAAAEEPENPPRGSLRPASAEQRWPSPLTARRRQTTASRPRAYGRDPAVSKPAPTACRRRQRYPRAPVCSGQTRWDKAPSGAQSRRPPNPRPPGAWPAATPPAAPAPPPAAPPRA